MPGQKQKTKNTKLIMALALVAIFTLAAGYFYYSHRVSVELPVGQAVSRADNPPASCSGSPGALETCGVPSIYKLTETQAATVDWRKGQIGLDSAQNESESFQIVVRSSQAMNDLALKLEDLKGQGPDNTTIPLSNIRVYKVEWVDINAPAVDLDGKPIPGQPAETSKNFQPDPLQPIILDSNCSGDDSTKNCFELKDGKNLIFWLTVTVPDGTAPGQYTSNVRVLNSSGAEATSLAVSLNVRKFALPKQPNLKSMVAMGYADAWPFHGANNDSGQKAIDDLYNSEYLRARFSPYLMNAFGPGNQIGYAFQKDANGIYNTVRFTNYDGQGTNGFDAFDSQAQKYLDSGAGNVFSDISVLGFNWHWNDSKGQFEYYLADTGSPQTVVKEFSDPNFDALAKALFGGLAFHLQQKGWLDRSIFYITDEAYATHVDGMQQLLQDIRDAAPGLKVAVTHDPFDTPELACLMDNINYDPKTTKVSDCLADKTGKSLISIWIPPYGHYNELVAKDQRSKGADYWLYNGGESLLDSGLTNRSVFWTLWDINAKGYEYWASSFWAKTNPWTQPNKKDMNGANTLGPGDGYLFYPPDRNNMNPSTLLNYVVPSIRWELMREGAEDYDYLHKLEDLIGQAKGNTSAAVKSAVTQGQTALNDAGLLAKSIGGDASDFMIRDLNLPQNLPTNWGAVVDTGFNWLNYPTDSNNKAASTLNISFPTGLTDGQYQLTVKAYNNPDYWGLHYSHFKINGVEYKTSESNKVGIEDVTAGTVTVKDGGNCSFTLSSVEDEDPYYGLIIYQIGLKPVVTQPSGGLYGVRKEIADAIESLQTALQTYTINASAGPNGTIDPSGSVKVSSGADQTFAIRPNDGYYVSSLTVDGSPVGMVSVVSSTTASSYIFSNVTADHTIAASFAKGGGGGDGGSYIHVTAGANGTISPSGSVPVKSGASKTFTITPNSGYKISSVLIDGKSVGAVTSYTLSNVTASHTISVTFAKQWWKFW